MYRKLLLTFAGIFIVLSSFAMEYADTLKTPFNLKLDLIYGVTGRFQGVYLSSDFYISETRVFEPELNYYFSYLFERKEDFPLGEANRFIRASDINGSIMLNIKYLMSPNNWSFYLGNSLGYEYFQIRHERYICLEFARSQNSGFPKKLDRCEDLHLAEFKSVGNNIIIAARLGVQRNIFRRASKGILFDASLYLGGIINNNNVVGSPINSNTRNEAILSKENFIPELEKVISYQAVSYGNNSLSFFYRLSLKLGYAF